MKPAIAEQSSVSSTPAHGNERRSAAARRVALVAEDTPTTDTPIWEPTPLAPNTIPTSSEVLNTELPKRTFSATAESELIGIITRPLGDHETHQSGGDNRERELRSYLASLSPAEAFALRKRLDADRSDDKIALAFRRLLVERRVRLRAFLADPRRGRG
jgi:hypothetical protein